MDNMMDIETLISQMTLEEKASLCSGKNMWYTESVERLGIPAVMMTDGPHGLRKQGSGEDSGLVNSAPATCFPSGVGLAATWNRELIGKAGVAMGEECRGEEVSILLGPAVNIKRSPLCGRNFEYLSEDPYLAGELAKAHISGVQSQGIGTSIKHYAVNNQEKRRMTVDAIVDERTLREIYLPAFETAIKECQPWTVMCAYNRLNGTYCAEHKGLLSDILKDEWGHEGIVMTDWGANNDRVAGLKAGQNLEMPGNGGINDKYIIAAVEDGTLDESVLDETVTRLLKVVAKSIKTLAANKGFTADLEAHHQFARILSSESMVLLKNERGLLPFETAGKTALIGKFLETPRYQGGGSSHINPAFLDTGVSAADAMGLSYTYASGYDMFSGETTEALISEAVSAAKASDRVILSIGLPDLYESEGFDREHMRMPEGHIQLLEAVLAVQPETVVVLSNGSPVEMPWIDSVDAVLEGYLAGQGGGKALLDIIFGKANPSGKLAESFPLRLEDNPSYLNFPGDRTTVNYAEGIFVGYRYYESKRQEVLFPFGHGLSYTDFSYGEIAMPANWKSGSVALKLTVPVTNTGKVSGKEVVQLYIEDLESSVLRPLKELKGFEKIELAPGETKEVSFELDDRSFAFWDTEMHDWRVEEGLFRVHIGASSADIRQVGEIFISPAQPFIPYFDENSMVEDLEKHPEGRRFAKRFKAVFTEQFGIDDPNSPQAGMVVAMASELPLRNVVRMTGGAVSEEQLALLLDIVNNRESSDRIDELL